MLSLMQSLVPLVHQSALLLKNKLMRFIPAKYSVKPAKKRR